MSIGSKQLVIIGITCSLINIHIIHTQPFVAEIFATFTTLSSCWDRWPGFNTLRHHQTWINLAHRTVMFHSRFDSVGPSSPIIIIGCKLLQQIFAAVRYVSVWELCGAKLSGAVEEIDVDVGKWTTQKQMFAKTTAIRVGNANDDHDISRWR